MEIGGKIPAIQVPRMSFGVLTMSAEQQGIYKESLNQYTGKARKSLEVLTFKEELTKGSNSFIPILINTLLPKSEQLLSLAQFGQAFNTNSDFFKGTYQDTAIIIRTNGDANPKNNYLTRNLFAKLKHRGFTPTPEAPVVISLTDFKKPKQINRSEYGLTYNLKENATPIVAPEYGTKESTTRFSIYDERGIPIPDKDGKHTIYKRGSGVSRVYSDYDQGAGSGDEHLAISDTDGRVVVGNVVSQDLAEIEKLVTQEEKRREAIKKDLQGRIEKFK